MKGGGKVDSVWTAALRVSLDTPAGALPHRMRRGRHPVPLRPYQSNGPANRSTSTGTRDAGSVLM